MHRNNRRGMLRIWKGQKAGLPSVYWHRWKSTDLPIWIFSIYQEYRRFLSKYSIFGNSTDFSLQIFNVYQEYKRRTQKFGIWQTKASGISPFLNIHVSRWTNRRRWTQWRSSMRIRKRKQKRTMRGLLRTSLQCGSFSFWVSGFLYLIGGEFSSQVGGEHCHFCSSVLFAKNGYDAMCNVWPLSLSEYSNISKMSF